MTIDSTQLLSSLAVVTAQAGGIMLGFYVTWYSVAAAIRVFRRMTEG